LASFDERKSRVIELRFFGGLSVEETASVLNVSSDTVMRDWRLAKVWLLRELKRYPDKAAHDKDRASALATPREAIQSAEARLRELALDRKRLLEEAEFYRGRQMPVPLKQLIDNNEVTAAAQRNAIKNSQAEVDRINAKFDVELDRLRKLWGDAQPGSLGPPPQ
jgi:hypothetical protein